jgi:hypothetical protein
MTDTSGLKQEDDDSEQVLLFCTDCDEEFLFGISDVVFSQLQGLNNVPKRCQACEEAFLLAAV